MIVAKIFYLKGAFIETVLQLAAMAVLNKVVQCI